MQRRMCELRFKAVASHLSRVTKIATLRASVFDRKRLYFVLSPFLSFPDLSFWGDCGLRG